ncbi:MAG: VCBS repeat-containing protein [Acidobacteriota bacterium]
MIDRPQWLLPLLLLTAAAGPVPVSHAEEDREPPPQLGVWRATVDGLTVTESVLPDVPLAAAPWPAGGLAVLTRPAVDADADDAPDPDELPRALHRVRGEAGDLDPVHRDLPPGLDSLHLEGQTLWLGGDGVLYRLADDGLDRVAGDPDDGAAGSGAAGSGAAGLGAAGSGAAGSGAAGSGAAGLGVAAPGVSLRALDRGDLIANGELWIPDVGRLLHVDAAGQVAGELELPVTADRSRRRLTLRSPPVTRLGDGTLIAGPQAAGATRVRHLVLAGADGGESLEAWSRLPRPEDVEHYWYTRLNGEPVFIAATTEADRLGVFEKMELRVFRLKADRSRAGRAPVLAIPTETIHWHELEPVVLDWNGDGRDDIAVVQPDGMGPGNLVIEVYLGRLARFEAKPKRTKLDAESATWHLGTDFDGDGRPDLAMGADALTIHRGLEHRRRTVDKDPWRQLTRAAFRQARRAVVEIDEAEETTDDRPSYRGRVRVADHSGDGNSDIAIIRRYQDRAVVRLVEIDP